MVKCACGTRTTLFCFVHRKGVCDDACLSGPGHTRCVVQTYRSWIEDPDHEWPPRCAACAKVIEEDPGLVVRLACLCLYHAACLEGKVMREAAGSGAELARKRLVCDACGKSMLGGGGGSGRLAVDAATFVEGVLERAPPRVVAAGAGVPAPDVCSPAASGSPPGKGSPKPSARRHEPGGGAKVVSSAPPPGRPALPLPARRRHVGPPRRRPCCTVERILLAAMLVSLFGSAAFYAWFAGDLLWE